MQLFKHMIFLHVCSLYHVYKFKQVQVTCDACFLRALLDNYTNAREAFPQDVLIDKLLEALLLSRKGLHNDPMQYVPQLLGRLKETKVLCYISSILIVFCVL